MAVSVVGGLI